MANKWIEHIKAWAAKNKTTYGCALSNPKCKEAYQANKNPPNAMEKKKPIPIELIKDDVKALPPISTKKQETFKKLTNIVGSKEFNDTIEEAIKDIYYDQLGGLFPREKIYKDKFLTLSKKNQDNIRATVRAKLMKDLNK